MDYIDYSVCIKKLRPNASSNWIIRGNDYSTFIWSDKNYDKPTEQEILDKRVEIHSTYGLTLIRNKREDLLINSDKYALPDWPHESDEKRQEWLNYRKSLRDMTTTQSPQVDSNGQLLNVTWPTPPS
tara:strand:+ start:1277 stop:1657 length:381 start_codon:yes stop_codon:yes gene_type:complete